MKKEEILKKIKDLKEEYEETKNAETLLKIENLKSELRKAEDFRDILDSAPKTMSLARIRSHFMFMKEVLEKYGVRISEDGLPPTKRVDDYHRFVIKSLKENFKIEK